MTMTGEKKKDRIVYRSFVNEDAFRRWVQKQIEADPNYGSVYQFINKCKLSQPNVYDYLSNRRAGNKIEKDILKKLGMERVNRIEIYKTEK